MAKFALLDRDGTIIVDKVYLRDPDLIAFAPGAVEGMTLLRDAGFELVLITNQSGIARGFFDEAVLDSVHARLVGMLGERGLRLAGVYYCPHGPNDGCECRKPAPGMALRAMSDLGFTASDAVMIGDSDADMNLAKAIGAPGVRIGETEHDESDFLAAAQRALELLR